MENLPSPTTIYLELLTSLGFWIEFENEEEERKYEGIDPNAAMIKRNKCKEGQLTKSQENYLESEKYPKFLRTWKKCTFLHHCN